MTLALIRYYRFVRLIATMFYNLLSRLMCLGDSRYAVVFSFFNTLNIVWPFCFIVRFGWACPVFSRSLVIAQEYRRFSSAFYMRYRFPFPVFTEKTGT